MSRRDISEQIKSFYDVEISSELVSIVNKLENKPSFTNDDSLKKMLYLASQKNGRNWDVVLNQLNIMFEDRITA